MARYTGPTTRISRRFGQHLLGSGMLQDLDHPSAGHLEMLASPVLVDGERLPIRRPPPTLGQHTAQVCKEILNMSEDEIATLTAAGILEE